MSARDPEQFESSRESISSFQFPSKLDQSRSRRSVDDGGVAQMNQFSPEANPAAIAMHKEELWKIPWDSTCQL